MKKSLLFIILLTSCISPGIEEIEFLSGNKIQYLPFATKQSQSFLAELKKLDYKPESYIASFKMQIQSFHPEKRNFNAKGKVFFQKETGKIKIQLMDSFFGMIFSQIISDSKSMELKTAGQDKTQKMPMGDIQILDPKSGKLIVIPFQVIYEFLSLGHLNLLTDKNNFFSHEEKRILSVFPDKKLIYQFDKTGLLSVELQSISRNVRAIARVSRSGIYPPENIITRVTGYSDKTEKDLVSITVTNVKKTARIEENTFRF